MSVKFQVWKNFTAHFTLLCSIFLRVAAKKKTPISGFHQQPHPIKPSAISATRVGIPIFRISDNVMVTGAFQIHNTKNKTTKIKQKTNKNWFKQDICVVSTENVSSKKSLNKLRMLHGCSSNNK